MRNSSEQEGSPGVDQRVRLTLALIQGAFLGLLREKPIRNISVKELCARAGINRGTFYLHYKDIYDLYERMEQKLLEDLDGLLANTPVIGAEQNAETSAAFIGALINFFERNEELCAILLGDNGDKQFVARIVERGRIKSVREYRALYPGITQSQAEMFYNFVAWGFIGLIQYNLQRRQPLSYGSLAAASGRMIALAAGYFEVPEEA